MFDFGSKKIHHKIPFQATSEKKIQGRRERGYKWELSLTGSGPTDVPPPTR